MEALQAKLQAEPSDETRAAAQTFSTKMSEWRRTALRSPLDEMPLDGFRKYLHERTPADAFSLQETTELQKLADRIADLFEASRRKGGYALRVPFGYWEAKDTDDDLDDEIEKKFRKGYPQDNIIFDDSHDAVLIQNRRQVMRCGVEDPEQLQKLLELYFDYERPEIADFRQSSSSRPICRQCSTRSAI
jgi:hypothetical protein